MESIDSVEKVFADLKSKTVTVEFKVGKVNDAALIIAIENAGYEV